MPDLPAKLCERIKSLQAGFTLTPGSFHVNPVTGQLLDEEMDPVEKKPSRGPFGKQMLLPREDCRSIVDARAETNRVAFLVYHTEKSRQVTFVIQN